MATITYEEASKVVDRYLESWQQYYHYYDRYAKKVANKCQKALKSENILCNVIHRAKELESLEQKLKHKIKTTKVQRYDSEEAIQNDIQDLAGVKVVLFWPSDKIKAKDILRKEFDIEKSSEKTDVATNGHARMYQWYSAHHFVARLKEQDLEVLKEFGKETKVEIQVGSAFGHALAETEHNISYKQLSGQVTLEIHNVIDSLGGLVQVSDIFLDHLRDFVDREEASDDKPFEDIYQLGSCLSKLVAQSPSNQKECYNAGQLREIYGELETLPRRAKENIMKSYEDFRPRISVRIMDHIVLSVGSASHQYVIEHKTVREILAVIISTFIWLDELFCPFSAWQNKLLSKNYTYTHESKIRYEDLPWLRTQEVQDLRNSARISAQDEERLRGIAYWLSGHPERPIKLAFGISTWHPSLVRDLDKDWHLFERAFSMIAETLWRAHNEKEESDRRKYMRGR